MNADVTNRLDGNGNLTGVTITGGVLSQSLPTLNSIKTVVFDSVQLPGAFAVFTISGLRVAVPTVTGGNTTPFVTALVAANQLSLGGQPVAVAISSPTLLSS